MSKIFLISEDEDKTVKIKNIANQEGYDFKTYSLLKENLLQDIIAGLPDIILIDAAFTNFSNITKIIKSSTVDYHLRVIILVPENFKAVDDDFPSYADSYIQENLSDGILKNILISQIKEKKSLDKMSEKNKELSRSLYQINTLYDTASQFAGTLQKEELCKIMLDGLDKILSFDIANVLIFDVEDLPKLYVNSPYEISEMLLQALTLRLTLNYKNLFNNKNLPKNLNYTDINIIKTIKSNQNIYDLTALQFDTLFAPIKVGENFFGVIEILRQEKFLKEDETCFQTIVHQVAPPLRSATLYEEIQATNVKLEKLERLKSEFVSVVSHELRTPLTPINNSLEIILTEQAGKITPEIRNFVNMAKRNMVRLSGIIEDLLDLSRVQTGKLELKFKKVNLCSSLNLIAQTFKQSAEDKKMDFTLSIKEPMPDVFADSHRIEQIISNLISNALKFTGVGGFIKLEAELTTIDLKSGIFINPVQKLADEYLKISVQDSGIGIDEKDREKIFDKFSQIESSLTRNIGGIGLGLAIVKQLADAHFALLSLESKKGEGSRFSLYLPLYSQKIAFQTEFFNIMTKSNNVLLLHVQAPKESYFWEKIKTDNILKLTKESRTLNIEDDFCRHLWVFTPKLEHCIFDFIEKKIKAELQNTQNIENCGIVFEGADKKDKKNLIKLARKINLTKGVEIEREDFNC